MRDTVFQEFINISFKTIRMLILKTALSSFHAKIDIYFEISKFFQRLWTK
jgi:hypothetical protein